MTKSYYVQRKADDLRIGNWFSGWALGEQLNSRRILDIRTPRSLKGKLKINLDDGTSLTLHPEHVVVVQELA